MSAIDWAPVGAASAAAVAAAASWKSVSIAVRSLRPDVHGQVLANHATGTVDIVIRNTGGGIAKGVAFQLLYRDMVAEGYADDGFLGPGEGARIMTNIPVGPRIDGAGPPLVIAYRDSSEVLRTWAADGGRRIYRARLSRRKHYPESTVMFGDLYPSHRLEGRDANHRVERLGR